MPELADQMERVSRYVDLAPGSFERLVRRRDRRQRNRRIGAGVLGLLVVIGAVVAFVLANRNQDVPVAPPQGGFMVDIDTGAITPLTASIASQGSEFAVSPLRTKIAYVSASRLHVANFDGTNDRIITQVGDDANGPQWSPDGSRLVYQQKSTGTGNLGNLYVYDVLTGRTQRITNLDQTRQWGWPFTFPSFFFDSSGSLGLNPSNPFDVLYQLPRGNPNHPTWDLWSVPDTGGEPTLVRRNAGWGASGLDVFGRFQSPGGIAFISPVDPRSFSGGTLWFDEPRGGPPQALVRSPGLLWPRWSLDGVHIAYVEGGRVYVVNVASGATKQVASGGTVNWVGDHTVVVGPSG